MADKNTLPDVTEANSAPENLGRREFLAQLWLAVWSAAVLNAWLARDVLAADIKATNISYRESAHNIDYKKLADSPVAEMLSIGEDEWMKNAAEDYEEDTLGVWRDHMIPEISSWKISKWTISELEEYTPKMLVMFADIDINHPKYGFLSSVWQKAQLDSLAKWIKS